MFSGQWGQSQPTWQPGVGQAPHRGEPVAKKTKSGTVITKYPPPPGYTGPGQAQAPYQPNGWQQHQQPYSYGQPVYPGYPPQNYMPPHSYQYPQYPGYPQQQQYPQAAYNPYSTHGQIAQGYNGYQPSAWQVPSPALQHAPPQVSPPPHFSNDQSRPGSAIHLQRHNSFGQNQFAEYVTATQTSTGQGSTLHTLGGGAYFKTEDVEEEKPHIKDEEFPRLKDENGEDLEHDYDEECYYAAHSEEVDPELSLGTIVWEAPLPGRVALPATFKEAELEAVAPRMPRPAGDDCISDYFARSSPDQTTLSVRQTETWKDVKDDPAFKKFPVICSSILSLPMLLEKYRDRPDPTWASHLREATPTPEPDLPQATAAEIDANQIPSDDINSGAMDIDDGTSSITSSEAETTANAFRRDPMIAVAIKSARAQRRNSRPTSSASTASQKITRPQPLMPVHDQSQEDVLAALGVTGSPKMVYQTPGPAFGAPPPEGYKPPSINPAGFPIPPPPPPLPPKPQHRRSTSYDPWRQQNGYANGRPGSSSSQHTAAGSDFQPDDQDATPRPAQGRKRGFEDAEDGAMDDRARDDDDATPRQRKKRPMINDVYSRRW